jgi:hypothetical protein
MGAPKSAWWDGLTFDTKGEMIIVVERIRSFARNLTFFALLPHLFIHTS